MNAVCPDQREKGSSRLLPEQVQSQGLSWYGVVSVPLAKVTCHSVMAPINAEKYREFGAQ